MTSNRKNSAVFVQVLTLLAAMFATVFIFRLIGGPFVVHSLTDDAGVVTFVPGWSVKTWLTLSAILFAQILSFGYGILMSGTSASSKKSFPFQFTAIGMIFLYDLGVMLLSLLALTEISIEWLASLHVISFVLLVIGLAAFHIGGELVEEIEIRDEQQRRPANEHKRQVEELVDMATRLKSSGTVDVHEVLSSLRDELEYATSESLVGSESIDGEIREHISMLNGMLRSLEAQDSNKDVSDTSLNEIADKVEELKIVVQRRDRLMISLRS